MTAATDGAEGADTVVVAYRAAEAAPGDVGLAPDHLVHERIHNRPFRTYLQRVHGGPVSVGDEWAEFVNCGCGTTTDVVLRVQRVAGGDRLDESTTVELVPDGPLETAD